MPGLLDLTSFLSPVMDKLADYIPDPAEKAKAKAEATTELLNFVTSQNTAQLAVDAKEASSKSVFVAGWRPAVGWICASGLAWNSIMVPAINGVVALVHPGLPEVHSAPVDQLITLLVGMLGMGAMRSAEKITGTAAPGAL